MKIDSPAIQRAIDIAMAAGNSIGSVSTIWRPKQTVFMTEPMTAAVRAQITKEMTELRAYSEQGTPHNPADEGFICTVEDVVISFPAAGETRRWY